MLSTTSDCTDPSTCASEPLATSLLNTLTLAERTGLLNRDGMHKFVDRERSDREFERWVSQPPFDKADLQDLFERRLDNDELDIETFKSVLGTTAQGLLEASGELPDWIGQIAEAFSASVAESHEERTPEARREGDMTGLLNLVGPLIERGYRRMQDGIAHLAEANLHTPFDPATFATMWFGCFQSQVFVMVCRTLILEMHVAKMEGKLTGATPEQRFTEFCVRLADPNVARQLLWEYPVLGRQVALQVDQCVAVGLEFLSRLCADWDSICETFSPAENPGCLVSFGTDSGDSHRGGRRVLVAEFTSGLKLVYKPRSLAVDVHFQQLLQWFNERGDHPALRTLGVLDRREYGWVEFVAADTCQSEDQVARFYLRQGAYLALLYVLQATDFHSENLVAAGEHPVMVDLESLLAPHEDALRGWSNVERRIGDVMNRSVLRTGLIPHCIWDYGDEDGIDISGLGSVAGQLTPYRVPYFEGAGTDSMRLKRARQEMSGDNNRPTLRGQEIDLLTYRKSLCNGFASAYNTLLRNRDQLESAGGPIVRFAEDEVRTILRPTQTYAFLLQESYHPDLLRDGLDRERLFDRLWIEAASRRRIMDVIPAEREDLQRGDIPIFAARPNSRDVWTSTGRRIANFFQESGLEAVRTCLQRMGDEDLDRQLWFLNASLAATVAEDVDLDVANASREPRLSLPRREELLSVARQAGDRLQELAVREADELSWLGLAVVDKHRLGIRPLPKDLYDGLNGITLFLAHLGHLTDDAKYTRLAECSLKTTLRYRDKEGAMEGWIGAFDGWGGFIYTLTQLGVLWDRVDLLRDAQQMAAGLPKLIAQTQNHGILSGTAGCLVSLLTLHRVCGDAGVLQIARQCGERLIETAQPMPNGVGWIMPGSTQPLAGFAHGSAGIAWSLLELAAVTGDQRFGATAREAIHHERSLFSPVDANWLDLRPRDESVHRSHQSSDCMVAWCSGAPGVGLGRLAALPHLRDEETRAEIQVAVRTTLRQGFGHNHSLCHGDLGNLEMLSRAGVALGDDELLAQADQLAGAVLSDIRLNGWRCGVPLHVEQPGLMSGLAGIGYGLLRLADPDLVPSVLTLEPPRAATV